MDTFSRKFLFCSGEVSITPKQYQDRSLGGFNRDSTCKGIHDRIYARIYVFAGIDSSEQREFTTENVELVLINYDLTGWGYKNRARLCQMIYTNFGITSEKIFTFATHSHYSPDTEGLMPAPIFPRVVADQKDHAYVDFVLSQTIKGLVKIFAEPRPILAHIGYGRIQYRERWVMNRRPPKGVRSYFLHPYLNILRIDDEKGQLYGIITAFPGHPIMIPKSINEISGGWPGFFATKLKDFMRKSNPELKSPVPLVLQGPAGNVNATHYLWYSRSTHTAEERRKHYANCAGFADTLMHYVEMLVPKIPTKPLISIKKHIEEINVPITPVFERLDKNGWRNILMAAIKRIVVYPFFTIFRRGNIQFLNIHFAPLPGHRFKRHQEHTFVSALRLNEVLIGGHPGEPYYDIEKETHQRVAYSPFFLVELCNDAVGYNWTERARIYNPPHYDGIMSFCPLMGIYTRSALVRILKRFK